MKGKMELSKTFRFDEQFSDFLGKSLIETGLSFADLVRISIPIALPIIKQLVKSTDSKHLAETVADAMLHGQQD